MIHLESENNIYHEQCCCLFASSIKSDDCHKRHYRVCDWKTNEYKSIFICNEFIRCELNNIRAEKNNRYIDWYDVNKVIHGIISNYVECNDSYNRYSRGNDLTDKYVTFNVLDRPWINHRVPFLDVIELYLSEGGKYMPHLYFEIKKVIVDYVEEITYKKYKTKYKNVIRDVKKLEYTYNENRKNLMNDIIIEIFEINFKLKKDKL